MEGGRGAKTFCAEEPISSTVMFMPCVALRAAAGSQGRSSNVGLDDEVASRYTPTSFLRVSHDEKTRGVRIDRSLHKR